jgi:N-acyl-D-aspartate/D-glutamate deacylase
MRRSELFVALLTTVAAMVLVACSTDVAFDVVIVGGSVIDGTGAEARRADIGIKGDRIVAIGNLADRSASQRIDASGKTVAPGFIDVMGRSGVNLLANGLAKNHLRQGITTELLVDGSPVWTPSTVDRDALRAAGVTFDWQGFDAYFRKLASRGTAINVGSLAALSRADDHRGAFIDRAMHDGAWGVVADAMLRTQELVQVADIVGRSDGVLMLPADSPGAASDDSLFSIADVARRVVITDVGRQPTGDSLAQLNSRISRTAQRSVAIYETVIPSPESISATSIAAALQYGSAMVATNSEETDAFPWLLGRIVRDGHLMELKEGIRRSTSVPATAFNIPQRGILRENYFADVVVFDPSTIRDRSTPEQPKEYAAGVDYVLVNGVITSTPRGITGARAGYGLRNKTRH